MTQSMEWSFHYAGPKNKKDDRDCHMCNAIGRGGCKEHPQSPMIGCGPCDAVRIGECAAHCGIEIAMKLHPVADTDPAQSKWVKAPKLDGDKGVRQSRVPAPMTEERQARRDAAERFFATVKTAVLAQAAIFADDADIDVTARGDAGLNDSRVTNVIIEVSCAE